MLGNGSEPLWHLFYTKINFSWKRGCCRRPCLIECSIALHLPEVPLASNWSFLHVLSINKLLVLFSWSGFKNRCSHDPKIDHFLEEPNPDDKNRLVEKPPYLTPYYSSGFYILKIYALRVTPESLLTSQSIRFAASAAKFSILRCLSCPEKQFYQIKCVFHIFSVRVNFWSF